MCDCKSIGIEMIDYKNIVKTIFLFLVFVMGILFIEGLFLAVEHNMNSTEMIYIIKRINFIISIVRPVTFTCVALFGIYNCKKYFKFDKSIVVFLILIIINAILAYMIVFDNWIYADLEEIYILTPVAYYRIKLCENVFFDNIVGMSIGLVRYNPSLFLAMCSLPFYILSSVNKNKIT